VRLAVNVSPIQFKSQTLALNVATALADSGLDPRRLELEITEAVLIDDDDAVLAILNQLRELGFTSRSTTSAPVTPRCATCCSAFRSTRSRSTAAL
jgi:predicted signal transduction protein with EAL and GGDEF domain